MVVEQARVEKAVMEARFSNSKMQVADRPHTTAKSLSYPIVQQPLVRLRRLLFRKQILNQKIHIVLIANITRQSGYLDRYY